MAARLRFLADESCDFAVVRALRAEGCDVVAVSESRPQADDRALIQLAHFEKRILLTEDKDFGWLVFVSNAESEGVILIRFPGRSRQSMVQSVLQVIRRHVSRLSNSFVVVQPGHIRISRNP